MTRSAGWPAALDATARKLQTSFQQVEDSRSELEAVLNSMQEPVIAISRDGRAQWANRRMEMLTPTGVRLGQPVVQTVRDPNFLAAVQEAAQHRKLVTARVNNFVPGRVFAATVAPMPSGGLVAVLHDLTEAESIETHAARFHRQRLARTAHAADLDPGLCRDPAGRSELGGDAARFSGDHPQERLSAWRG